MKTIALGLVLCISSTLAQSPGPDTPKQEYDGLLKEFAAAVEAWEKIVDQAKPDSESDASASQRWPGVAFVPRFLKFAEANSGDPLATDALLWVVDKATNIQVGSRDFYPHYRQALELLARLDRLDDKRLGRACALGLRYPSEASERFLHVVIDQSGDRGIRGRATLALARILYAKAEIAPRFDPKTKSRADQALVRDLDPDYIKYVRDVDIKASHGEAEGLFERCIKEYGDIVYLKVRSDVDREMTVADAARSGLRELRELAIGKVAPEIDGEDLDGRPMKLSDHRGQVVVLVFWATWCGPCMDLVPHERSLVERLRGQPFVLLGINGDQNRERAKRAVKLERIRWRSWWNGGPRGPITGIYNVEGWPTVYVLDHHGVIRHKQVVEEQLDEAVDALLKVMENRPKP